MKEKILTKNLVRELGLDKASVITADMLKGYTSIGDYSFIDCNGLTSITIPNSVTGIGCYAFYGCRGMTSVTIPNSVTNIENGAFSGCNGLTSIEIPNSVTSIGEYAFENCTGLTSITIPNSVTSIGRYAFENCTGLSTVTLNSNTIVGKDYTYNSNIKSIFGEHVTEYILSDEITRIGEYAFYNCSGMTSVTIPNSVTSIGNRAFEGCNGLTSIKIPNSVTNIENHVFAGCTGLTSVTIPNSVTNIGGGAFYGCDDLTSVVIGNMEYKTQKVIDGKCKAYKAFNADMTCRYFQYEEGKTYEFDGEPMLCHYGFHACLNLADVFNYYYGNLGEDIVVHEVELEGVSDKHHVDDSKIVAKKITIGKRIL